MSLKDEHIVIKSEDNITEIKRFDDISIRKIEKKINTLENTVYELVKWYRHNEQKELCYVLAILRYGKEEPKWEFVGDRPFNYKNEGGDLNKLWNLMEYGQKMFQVHIYFYEK
jgi:hypothetical protein